MPNPQPSHGRKVQRNEPCPCGSGKKYKQCCLALAHAPDPDALKHKLYEAYGLLFGRVSEFVHDELTPDFMVLAWSEFHQGDPPEMDPDSSEVIEFFLPWMLFYWRPELPFGSLGLGDADRDEASEVSSTDESTLKLAPMADMFLDAINGRGDHSRKYVNYKLTPTERSLIKELGQSPYSFFQVKEITDNKHVKVTDLIVERHETVFMPEFAEELSEGCIIYGQVICVDDIAILPSVAPMIFFENIALALGRLQQQVTELVPELGENWRREMDHEIRGLYRELIEQPFEDVSFDEAAFDHDGEGLPQFAGSSDLPDPSAPALTMITYALSGRLEDHVEALAHLSGNTAEELLCCSEFKADDDGAEHETVSFEWTDDDLSDEWTHFGEIVITAHQLRANLIGQESPERFEQELEQHFRGKAQLVDRKVLTVGDLMGQLIEPRVNDRINRRK
jgi:hypothetical protein